MTNKKLRTARILMTSSILLLLAFQGYWLRNAYNDEFKRLRRELSITLRETVLRQQIQSFMVSGIKPPAAEPSFRREKSDDTLIIFQGDSGTANPGSAQTQINILVRADSTRRPMRPNFVFENERHFDDEVGKELKVEFPVPLGINNIKAVEEEFRKKLNEAGYNLSFTIIKKAGDSTNHRRRRIEIKNRMPGIPESLLKMKPEVIEASFSSPFFYILKKIQWQLLFAVGMLVFTAATFVFMYRTLRQQQQLAVIKNDFIANITHELKTPVATVSVAIEALKNFNAISDAQRTKEYLDISTLELQRLNLLVDKVMKLSMFEQDKMDIQQERIDMKQLTEEVVKSMKLQFEKYQADVSVHFDGALFLTRGDRMHLQSVVFNLIDNALKYSPNDPKIRIELLELPSTLQLKITDNGIGIASEYKQKVFEKFFRVPHGDTHNIKGYGLGLSYVHEVVQRHGGTIGVESKEGAGSIFTVELKREA